ncbi:MAG: hypothetical protein GF320_03395 [Armatimonadia bacterium]|nr:hypothetical protein [Armatimonadia bacterium]
MSSDEWAREYAFEKSDPTRQLLRGLLGQADRLMRDAEATVISVPLRYTAAHGAVLHLARLALAAYGYRTLENHHFWAIESLQHTLGLEDELVAVLHEHRSKRHDAAYGASPSVTETELRDLMDLATDLRARILAWLEAERRDAWG